jgi:hypothetical protein
MSNTSPPSAKANKFVIGILISLERALKIATQPEAQTVTCQKKLGGSDAKTINYSQLCSALRVRVVQNPDYRANANTTRYIESTITDDAISRDGAAV